MNRALAEVRRTGRSPSRRDGADRPALDLSARFGAACRRQGLAWSSRIVTAASPGSVRRLFSRQRRGRFSRWPRRPRNSGGKAFTDDRRTIRRARSPPARVRRRLRVRGRRWFLAEWAGLPPACAGAAGGRAEPAGARSPYDRHALSFSLMTTRTRWWSGFASGWAGSAPPRCRCSTRIRWSARASPAPRRRRTTSRRWRARSSASAPASSRRSCSPARCGRMRRASTTPARRSARSRAVPGLLLLVRGHPGGCVRGRQPQLLVRRDGQRAQTVALAGPRVAARTRPWTITSASSS